MRRLRVFTWHVHGNYLFYLSHADCEFVIPVKPGRPNGYGGRTDSFPWPENVREVAVERLAEERFDVVLFQSQRNYLVDQYEVLSPQQRELPKVYLEHDPPREHPTDTRHPVSDRRAHVLVVHVTHFNRLMWDNGTAPTRVIEHGVPATTEVWTGELARGLVVVNNLRLRGRRLGSDLFQTARSAVPLDLVGMDAASLGGLGEIPPRQLQSFSARYRFFYNPIRYTSLGLAVCEAMMLGMPVVGLATTEMAAVIDDGTSGYISTNPQRLHDDMRQLLRDRSLAQRIGRAGQEVARERFGLDRFAREWTEALQTAASRSMPEVAVEGVAG